MWVAFTLGFGFLCLSSFFIGSPPFHVRRFYVLGLLAAVSPKKVHCSKAGCSQKVSLADRFCAACGEPNTVFSEEAAELVRSGRRSGWYKPPAPAAVVPENAAEEKMEWRHGGPTFQAAEAGQPSAACRV